MYGLSPRLRVALYVGAAGLLLGAVIAASRSGAGGGARVRLMGDVDGDGVPEAVAIFLSRQGEICWAVTGGKGREARETCVPAMK
ncbi:MAG TPA: hypothetical protein VD969_21290 [Symbiobacteriaceae bacterium]|nr:hypothetical protein [Symbiobacteriaceae bacterium]